jgi:DNA modification methylase
LVKTHSNPGDLVVDPFAGYGTTGIVALKTGRRFLGCEKILTDAEAADVRCREVM